MLMNQLGNQLEAFQELLITHLMLKTFLESLDHPF